MARHGWHGAFNDTENLRYDLTNEEYDAIVLGLGYDEDEEDDYEYGCIQCGNPNYPKCKSSCPVGDE